MVNIEITLTYFQVGLFLLIIMPLIEKNISLEINTGIEQARLIHQDINQMVLPTDATFH